MEQNIKFNELVNRVDKNLSILEDKPEESSESTVRTLWHLAAGNALSVQRALELDLPVLEAESLEKLEEYIKLREKGVPLAHITNRQQFMGIELIVGKDALVPRKETELLGYAALGLINEIAENKDAVKVIDVCTGSGNLALAFAWHQKRTIVSAADLDEKAISLAKQNNKHLKLESRVNFFTGDLLEPFATDEYFNSVDVLTCNPPYISSGKLESMPDEIISFEPSMAFDGGPFGIKILGRIIKEAPKYLNDGGWLAFEVGLGQGEPLLKRLEKNKNYKNFRTVKNETGEIRVILAST